MSWNSSPRRLILQLSSCYQKKSTLSSRLWQHETQKQWKTNISIHHGFILSWIGTIHDIPGQREREASSFGSESQGRGFPSRTSSPSTGTPGSRFSLLNFVVSYGLGSSETDEVHISLPEGRTPGLPMIPWILDGLPLIWRTIPVLPIPGRLTLRLLMPGRGPGLPMPGEMEPGILMDFRSLLD